VSGKASRRYRDLRYRTRSSWSRERRAVAKVEWLPGLRGRNARYVVTNVCVGQSLQALSGSAVSDPLVMVPRAPCGSKGRVAAGTSGPTAWLWHLYMQLVEIESTPTYYPQNLISVWP